MEVTAVGKTVHDDLVKKLKLGSKKSFMSNQTALCSEVYKIGLFLFQCFVTYCIYFSDLIVIKTRKKISKHFSRPKLELSIGEYIKEMSIVKLML